MAAIWTFDDLWAEEFENDDEQVVVERAWLGFYHDNGALQARTITQARDAFNADKAFEIGQANADYPGAAFKSLRISRRENVEAFEFAARWQTKDGSEAPPDDFDQFMSQSQQNSPENPHGPDYEIEGQFAEEYSHKDIKGKPFLNKAKQPLTNVPPLMVTIQIERVSFNTAQKPNISQQGVAEGRRLLYKVAARQETHKNKVAGTTRKYFRSTYEVWTHPFRDWATIDLLNVGFAFLLNGKLEVAVLGKAKNQPLVEVNLTPDGKGILEDGTEPNTIPFTVFREGTLDIPFL